MNIDAANRWYLCTDGVSVFHSGYVGADQHLVTGQPIVHVFETLELLNTKLAEYGQPPYTDSQQIAPLGTQHAPP